MKPVFYLSSLLTLATLLVLWQPGHAAEPNPNPFFLIGVDGMEWSVVDDLSAKGQLPNIKAFRARAATAKLATDYGANSPIVWTTVATGMNKEVHGITNFDVATDTGTAPVSSSMRKVPAIWNMVSLFNRKVMMLGWWGSWPAETVNGVIVTDRAHRSVENRVSPASFESTFAADLAKINADRSLFPLDEDSGAEDRIMSWYAVNNANAGYNLILTYIHGTDLVSHKYWKYYRPDGFSGVDEAKKAKYQDIIPGKYRAVDGFLGKLVAAAPKNANIIIISDHGFGPLPEEFIKVSLELDPLLVHLGLLTRSGSIVDFSKTKVYNYETAGFQMQKMVRFAMAGRENGGTVTPETQGAVRQEVTEKLAKVTYEDGSPVFSVRDAKPYEQKKGADFVIEVLTHGASMKLLYQGQVFTDVVKTIVEHSGGHGWLPPGVFLAAGPDIDPKVNLEGIRIHDITPTVLYGMGLPIAQDFNGKAWTSLYSSSFQKAHPTLTIPSYGQLGTGKPTENTETDQEMLEQLRALGYIP
jgi:predicted AlkP superfamily phosphohydrolase/phosphomutase